MNFITFAVCLALIFGLARITSNVNWKIELADMRRFFRSLRVKKHL